jgi:SAM-dependent methyltransferase
MLLRFARERYASDVARHLLAAPAELLLDALPPLVPQTRFLEVCAGAGVLAKPLGDRIAGLGRLVAVDVDLGLAQHLPSAKGRAARALAEPDRLPFQSGAFDVVIANLVLGDAVEDGPRLAELRRVMRPGGWLLATVLLRGSFDALLDVLTESCEADELHASRQALLEARRSLPDEETLERALKDVGVDVGQIGIEERALFFADGHACLGDPLVTEVLLPSWLGDAPALPAGALEAAARAVDTYFGGRFALRLRTAIVTGRAHAAGASQNATGIR